MNFDLIIFYKNGKINAIIKQQFVLCTYVWSWTLQGLGIRLIQQAHAINKCLIEEIALQYLTTYSHTIIVHFLILKKKPRDNLHWFYWILKTFSPNLQITNMKHIPVSLNSFTIWFSLWKMYNYRVLSFSKKKKKTFTFKRYWSPGSGPIQNSK